MNYEYKVEEKTDKLFMVYKTNAENRNDVIGYLVELGIVHTCSCPYGQELRKSGLNIIACCKHIDMVLNES